MKIKSKATKAELTKLIAQRLGKKEYYLVAVTPFQSARDGRGRFMPKSWLIRKHGKVKGSRGYQCNLGSGLESAICKFSKLTNGSLTNALFDIMVAE